MKWQIKEEMRHNKGGNNKNNPLNLYKYGYNLLKKKIAQDYKIHFILALFFTTDSMIEEKIQKNGKRKKET